MQLQRIIVGTDFSAGSVAAAQWTATRLAPDAEIVLAHVLDAPEPPRFLRSRIPPGPLVEEMTVHDAEQHLEEQRIALGRSSVRTRVLQGRPAEQLAELARQVGADAIVVSKQGERGGLWKQLGGSADQLLRVSPVPVVLVTGEHDAAPRRLLSAFDDSDITPLVVGWTRVLANAFGAHVTAIHVMAAAVLSHVLSTQAVATGKSSVTEAEIREEVTVEADRWMTKLVGSGMDASRVTSEVAFGDPAEQILAAADRLSAGMIILGRRGAGRIRRVLLGSVALAVVNKARCPVFVVVEPVDEIAL